MVLAGSSSTVEENPSEKETRKMMAVRRLALPRPVNLSGSDVCVVLADLAGAPVAKGAFALASLASAADATPSPLRSPEFSSRPLHESRKCCRRMLADAQAHRTLKGDVRAA